jgi:hypothetical protein
MCAPGGRHAARRHRGMCKRLQHRVRSQAFGLARVAVCCRRPHAPGACCAGQAGHRAVASCWADGCGNAAAGCVLTRMQSEDCGPRLQSGSARRECADRSGQALRATRGRACILRRRAPRAAVRRGADASGAARRCATCCRRSTWRWRFARAEVRARWRAASAACWPCRRAGPAAGLRKQKGRRAEGRAVRGRAPGSSVVLAWLAPVFGVSQGAGGARFCCPPAEQHLTGLACIVKLSRVARVTTADACKLVRSGTASCSASHCL